ncbi:AN1-type zinc finger protein 2B [Trypanosoma grayi]|uniref:AN1-type zinc finger protein 2B n=1 Tax=Trypanosoma grayi TaxID=71804 RepID=UPI0004F42793|nr:AN1-type zinc finger protein 2B [Trypanosoma grayi]KEG15153.1 AN1-type zinc finger protein 2B [Trypanosoma grayi]
MQVGVQDDESKRCTFPGCEQVDFLAARCGLCGGMFCCEHTAASAHSCPAFDKRSLLCPICGHHVPLEHSGQSPDEAVSRHIDRGCCPAPSPKARKERMNYCSYDGCTKNDPAAVICENCRNMYCIEHRAPARHRCRAARKLPVESPPPQSPGSVSTCAQMQLKNSPCNTPSTAFGKKTENSVTPLITFAKGLSIAPFFMHFSNQMVMGRLLDLAVSQAALGSANINSAKGMWVVHVLQGPRSSRKYSLQVARLSATLQETGVKDGTVVYIGKEQNVPESVLTMLVSAQDKNQRKNRKSQGDCILI